MFVSVAAALIGLSLFCVWHGYRSLAPSPISRLDTPSHARAAVVPAQPGPTPDEHGRASAAQLPPDTIFIPSRYQLPGVARAKTADNFDAWMEKFPPEDRKRIEAFADRYYGVYEIASAKQIEWMAQAGYPMPEDLIAAANMSDAELRHFADKGNIKATILLNDRQMSEAIDKLKQLDPASPQASDIRSSNFTSLMRILNSDTPFKGYAEAADAMYLDQNGDDARAAGIAAGLMRADALGDARAGDALSDYADAGIVSDQGIMIAERVFVALRNDPSRSRSLENCPPARIRVIPKK